MKKKIYIAGPMTGLPELNFPAFHAEAAWLRAMGNQVINPAEINVDVPANFSTEAENHAHWQQCMRLDIAQLVTCDRIHMLAGWENSRGATLEHHIALSLGMEVTFAPTTITGVRNVR